MINAADLPLKFSGLKQLASDFTQKNCDAKTQKLKLPVPDPYTSENKAAELLMFCTVELVSS